jgi:hypothetical protein
MKICPLFFASADDLRYFDCRQDLCAWSDGEACAIVRIAESLDVLDPKGLETIKNYQRKGGSE